VRHFEVGSFLPRKPSRNLPTWTTWFGTVAALPGAHGVALALNERGVNEALALGVAEIASRRLGDRGAQPGYTPIGRARRRSPCQAAGANVRDASAHKPIVHAAISMALGCSISRRGRSERGAAAR